MRPVIGEDYNLATGLRQGILQPLTSFAFHWPIALMGFPVHAFLAHAQLNTLYVRLTFQRSATVTFTFSVVLLGINTGSTQTLSTVCRSGWSTSSMGPWRTECTIVTPETATMV